jgi:protein gp37
MNPTKIEWTDLSWNPLTGCLGPRGNGVRCPYCYAHRLAKGRLQHLYLANPTTIAGNPSDPFAPRLWPSRLDEPRSLRAPSRIFVGSMCDLFGDWVPHHVQEQVIDVAVRNPRHVFQFLTRWPQNYAQFGPWPANCWLGATATDADEVATAREALWNVGASVHFLSIEPLLGPIYPNGIIGLDWLIVGAMTGPTTWPPNPEWIDDISKAATKYNVPLFLKNSLHLYSARQEWPKGYTP